MEVHPWTGRGNVGHQRRNGVINVINKFRK